MKNFGTQFFGQFTAFRLNCKMTSCQAEEMQEAYPMLHIEQVKGDLTRIEGAMGHDAYYEFKLELSLVLATYKSLVAHTKAEDIRKFLVLRRENAEREAMALAPLGDIRA